MDQHLWIQILTAVASAAAVYGAVKADIKNIHHRLDEEREARKEAARENEKVHHDLRGDSQALLNRLARLEGRDNLAHEISRLLKKGN